MSECDGTTDLLELLDGYTMAILSAAKGKPVSAKTILRETDVPTSTLYRRLDALVSCGVLEESARIGASGNHHSVYETPIDAIRFDVDSGTVSLQADDGTTASAVGRSD